MSGITLTISSGRITSSSYTSGPTEVTIPGTVTQINANAFNNSSVRGVLTKVTIPASVTYIANAAFGVCSKLTSVIFLGDGLRVIDMYAFSQCTSLNSINIPSSVTSIGIYAFNQCASLTSITIPSSVTSIGTYAFANCTLLTSVSIPSSVVAIDIGTFQNCVSLPSITIPDSVTLINREAFSGCSNLSSITLPSDLRRLEGGSSFNFCSSLTSITIPSSVTFISGGTFGNCTKLTSVTFLGNNITVVSSDVFKTCTSLTSINIPNSVTAINSSAFERCTSLTSITIPSSVTLISFQAFKDCSSLTSITIPSSVTLIDYQAFLNCFKLTSIIFLGNSITSIASDTFNNCSSLTSINIPNSVTLIRSSAFYQCSSLTSIIIPSSVTSLSTSSFSYCSKLTSVTFLRLKTTTQNLTSLGTNCFSNTGITLTNYGTILEMIILGYIQTQIVTNANISSTIYNRAKLVYDFLNLATSSTSINTVNRSYNVTGVPIIFPRSVTTINSSVFLNLTTLSSVTISKNVTSVGTSAFQGCTNLTSVTLQRIKDEGLTTLGTDCFLNSNINVAENPSVLNMFNAGYTKNELITAGISEAVVQSVVGIEITVVNGVLTSYSYVGGSQSLIIPNTVTSIAPSVFLNFLSFERVTIPSSVTSIGSRAFEGCAYLQYLSLERTRSEGLTTLGLNCFLSTGFAQYPYNIPYFKNFGYTRRELITAGFPEANTNIHYPPQGIEITVVNGVLTSSFYDYGSTNLSIPTTVTAIDPNAFLNLNVLTSVNIPSTVLTIGSNAFKGCSSLTSITLQRNTIQGLTTLGSDCFLNTGFTVTNYQSILTMYNAGYTKNNLITSGITTNVIRQFIPSDIEIIVDVNGVLTSASYVSGSTDLIIPSTVVSIGPNAFLNLNVLSSVTIPSTVTSIDSNAFEGCTSLVSVTFERVRSQGLTTLGSDCFLNTGFTVTNFQSLSNMYNMGYTRNNLITSGFPINVVNLVIPLGIQIIVDANGVLTSASYEEGSTSLVIPSTVVSIGSNAFLNLTVLTNVIIPSSVVSIGSNAFQGCFNLTNVIIPSSVVSIASSAFQGCLSLVSVTLQRLSSVGLTSLGTDCFLNTGFTVTNYGPFLEMLNNGYTPSELTISGFQSDLVNRIVTVYDYLNLSLNKITIISCNQSIDITGITIIIPNSVTSIGSNAFKDSILLSSVIISRSVVSIASSAFQGCSNLTSVILNRVIGEELTSLGTNCFLNTAISIESILAMYRMKYSRYNLISSGIPINTVDQVIVSEDGFVNITVYYYTIK
jgi:hypothetical protein